MEQNVKVCSTLQPGRMDLPGVSHKKYLQRLKDKEPWSSEVCDTKDPRHPTSWLKKHTWQLMKGIILLQNDWHQSIAPPGTLAAQCWAGYSKGKSFPHFMPLILCAVDGLHLITQQAQTGNPNHRSHHGLVQKQKFQIITRRGGGGSGGMG